MSLRIHAASPAEAVEAVFFRIQQTSMADVPILNPALSVEAIDFQRWQGHWLGVVITPWCMSVLLVPGSTEPWEMVGDNKRRFVNFPAGDFAFLGSSEVELGHFQSCALFSPMDKFASQSEASMTARASLMGLLSPPPQAEKAQAKEHQRPVMSRRGFLALRKS
jgi:[NiFe] hydrogenase assembly HybE family chaperone